MNTVLRVSKHFWAQMKYAFLIPVFFFVFIIIYDPFSFKTEFQMGGKSWTFHLLMLTSIMIGVLAITRLGFYFLYKFIELKWGHYVIWCFGEVLVTSFFFALYTSLFHLNHDRMPYFTALAVCLKYDYLVLCYPYLFAILSRIIRNKDLEIEEAGKAPEESLVKLYDEHKRLKLTIDPSAIVYVGAEANYIRIHYIENDREKTFVIRNSLKSFEEPAQKHGIVRCHRSFYVNPRFIKLLSRGEDGIIYTVFNVQGMDRIPVSKMYYDNLASLL